MIRVNVFFSTTSPAFSLPSSNEIQRSIEPGATTAGSRLAEPENLSVGRKSFAEIRCSLHGGRTSWQPLLSVRSAGSRITTALRLALIAGDPSRPPRLPRVLGLRLDP